MSDADIYDDFDDDFVDDDGGDKKATVKSYVSKPS